MSSTDQYQIKVNSRIRDTLRLIPFEAYYKLDGDDYTNLGEVDTDGTFTDYSFNFTTPRLNYNSITIKIQNKDGIEGDRSNIFDKIELFLWDSTINSYSSNLLGDPNLILENEYSRSDTNYNFNYISGVIGNWNAWGNVVSEKGPSHWGTGITNETLIIQGANSSVEQKLSISRNNSTRNYTNAYKNERVENYILEILAAEKRSTNQSHYPYVFINNVQIGRLDFSSIGAEKWNKFTFNNITLDPTVSSLELIIQVNRNKIPGYYIDNVKLFHENDLTTNLIYNYDLSFNSANLDGESIPRGTQEEWYFDTNVDIANVTSFTYGELREGNNQIFLPIDGRIMQTLDISRNMTEQSTNPNTFDVDLSFSNVNSTDPNKLASYTFNRTNQSPLSVHKYTNYFEQYKLQFNARSRYASPTTEPTTDIYYSTTDVFDATTTLVHLDSVSPTHDNNTLYSYDISLSPTTEYFAISFKNSSSNNISDGNCFYNIQLIAYDPATGSITTTNLIADSNMKLGTTGLDNNEWYWLTNRHYDSWYIYNAIHEKNSTQGGVTSSPAADVHANTETVCILSNDSSLIQEFTINRTFASSTSTSLVTTTFTNKITNQITNSYVYNISSFTGQNEYTYDPPSQINFITFGGSGTGDLLFTVDPLSKIRLSASSNYISGSSLENLSDNTNNATITGTVDYTYKDGRYCYYIHDTIDEFWAFYGYNYITLPSGLLTNLNKYTFSGFFNFNKYDGRIFGSNNGLFLSVSSYNKKLFLNSPITGNIFDTYELTLNTWYHISYTYDHDIQETKIYINGSLVITDTRFQFNLVEPLFIGAYNNAGTIDSRYGFYFDAINIYDKVLTPEQIAKMYPSITNTLNSIVVEYTDTGDYTVTAFKEGDQNYLSTSNYLDFTINPGDQAEFELSGVLISYDYKEDITFDTSGGSSTGDVSFILEHDTFGIISIDNNRLTEDISGGDYRVIATKFGDSNYKDISAHYDFTIDPINQASLIITDIQPLYNYKHDIYFNVEAESTGKTTAVVEESGVYTEVTSPFNIYDRNATNYITASNEGDINYNETTSSNSVAINLTNSDIKVPSENYILKIVAAESPYNSNPSYYPIVIVNDIQVGRLDFSFGTGIWKEFTFNTSIDVLISSLEIKIQVIRETITGYYIDNVQLFHESDNTTNLIFNPGMYLNSTLSSNSQYGAWYVSSNIQQVTGGTESFSKNNTNPDNNHVFINNNGFIKHSLQIDRTLTPQIANPNTFDVNLTFSNSNVVDQTNTINYTFDISNQEQPLSIIPSTLLEKYKLEFNCRPRLDSANTTDIYYSTSNAYNSDEFNINGIVSSSTLKNRISTSSKFIKLGTITPTNEDDTLHSFIFSLPPIFDLLTVHFINTNSISGMANSFYNIQLFAINPYTDIDTGINLISDPNVQLGTNGLDDESWYSLTNGYNDSWYTNNIAHEKNFTTEGINANTETLIIQGSGYLIQELSVTRTFNNSTNEITTSFKNRPTNQVTGSYTYSVPTFYYSPSPQKIYVLSSGGSGYGDLSFTGDLTVDSDRALPTTINANDYTINATKLGDTYYNDSATTFTLTINPGDQAEFELSGVLASYDYKEDITFDTSGGSSTGDVLFTVDPLSKIRFSASSNYITDLSLVNLSDNTNNATITGTVDYTYKDGRYCYYIHPNESYITLPTGLLTSTNKFTFSAFYYLNTDDIYFNRLLGSSHDADEEDPYAHYRSIDIGTRHLLMNNHSIDLSNVLTYDSWNFFCYTYDNDIDNDIQQTKVYINGSLVNTKNSHFFNLVEPLILGASYYQVEPLILGEYNQDGTPRSYGGFYFDAINIYDEVLTPEQIAKMYPSTTNTLNSIVGEYTDTGDYTVTAFKEGDQNYLSTSNYLDFTINPINQAEFELSGVLISYDYKDDIIFDTSGGSSTGDVSFVLEHATFGIISIDNNTLTENISGGNYRVIATKDGDSNYKDISATFDFSINPINQADFELSGVLISYDYKDDIIFDTSGGSSTGDVSFVLEHATFGIISIDNNTLTEDISGGNYRVIATKDGDSNYKDISATFDFSINPINQADFELSGVLISYDYKDDIIFDTSGGSSTGDVSFVLEHATFGIISIDNNTLTEDISGGNYRVIATKFGDSNYNDISAHYDFSINPINQAEFELSGVLASYDYKDDIIFDTSGGSGTGDVLFTVDPLSKIRFSASSNYITDLSLVNLSDNTKNATITGTVDYTYKDGRYCYYIHPHDPTTATASYITLPTGLLTSTNKFTFSAFYYLNTDDIGYNRLLGSSHGADEEEPNAHHRSIDIGGRQLIMNNHSIDLSNVLTYDSWNFFCYTYDDDIQQTKVYINGSLVNTANNKPFNLVEPLFIGAYNQVGTIQAYGGFYFDAINIYDTVLTPEQIAKMYPSTTNTLPNDVTISDYTVTAFKEADQNYLSTSNYFDFTINQPGNMPVEKYILKIVAAERDSENPSYYPCVLINNVQVGRLDFSSINKATWNEFTFNINLDPTVSSLELKIQVNRFTVTGYYIDNVKLFHENDSTTNLIFNPGMYVDNSEFLNGVWGNWNVQYGEWYFGTNIGLFNVTTFANDNLRDGDNYQLFLARAGHIKQTLNITRNSIEQSANPNTFDVDLSFSNPFSTEPVKSASYTFSSSNQSPLSTYVYTNYFEQYKLQFNARSRPNNTITLFTDIYYSTTDAFDTPSLVLLGTVSPTYDNNTLYSYDISLSPTTEYFSIHFKNNSDAHTNDGNCFYNVQLIAYNPTTGITTNTNLIADSNMKLGSGGLNEGEWYRLYNIYNESWYVYSAIHEKNSTQGGNTDSPAADVYAHTETVCIIGSSGSLIQELAINRTYDTVSDKITTTFTNKINNQITNSYDYTRNLNIANAQYEYSSPSQFNFTTYGGSGTGDLLFTVDPLSKIRLSASSNYISGTSLVNLSDNTNNATITGTVEYTYIGGRYCYYIYNSIRSGSGTYDGTKNYITLPTGLLDSTNKFTFSAFYYIKTDFVDFVDYNFLLGSSHGVTEPYAYRRSVDIGGRKIYMNSNSSTLDLSTVLNHDSWNFFCYTYDNYIKQTKVYINGSLVNTVDDASFNLVEPLFIGAFNELGDIKPYGGFYFDAINIYDTVLTPEQIAKMYPSTLNTDISPGDYTVTAFNEGDQNYLSTSNSFELNIIPGDQADFELSGVLISYDYKEDITFDTSGGSSTGDVSFVLEHATFGIISIDNNTLTENISGGKYRVIATKDGDINYKDVSATFDFTINPTDQTPLAFDGLNSSYLYTESISWSTSGGDGLGEITYDISGLTNTTNVTFDVPNIVSTTYSVGDYSFKATKAATINYNESQVIQTVSITKAPQSSFQTDYGIEENYRVKVRARSYDSSNLATFNVFVNISNTSDKNDRTNDQVIINEADISTSYSDFSADFSVQPDINYLYIGLKNAVSNCTLIVDSIELFFINPDGSLSDNLNYIHWNTIGAPEKFSDDPDESYKINSDDNYIWVMTDIFTVIHGLVIERNNTNTFTKELKYRDYQLLDTWHKTLSYQLYYGLNLYFFNTGGSTTNTVTYEPSIVNNTWTTPDAGIYTIIATKPGDNNYFDISNSVDISINRAEQDPFAFVNLQDYYDYQKDISFNTTGGTGNGEVSYTISHNNYNTIDLEGNELTFDISVGTYTITALKQPPDNNYNSISAIDTFIINGIDQSELFIIGVNNNYDYTENIVFSTTGGDGNGDVSFVLLHDTFGTITINGNTLYEDISAGHYTVKAFKFSDGNYNDISATFDFSINPIVQADFELYNVDTSFNYREDIVFDTSGGSGDGVVSYEIDHDTYGEFTVDGNTFTEDISVGHYTVTATKATSLNFIDISATFDFSINPIVQADFELYNVDGSFNYREDIVFDTSGGSGDGVVSYEIDHETYGEFTVDGNTFTEDISVGHYTVTATKASSLNFIDISATFDFSINPIVQADFELYNVDGSFNYREDIVFDTSGGSGNGVVSYEIDHETYGEFTVDGNTFTEDISVGHYTVTATKAASLNFIDISATFDFSINPIDQADFELYNVDTSYNHRDDIVFDTSGGSGDGVVSYTVKHDTYGLFTVDGDTFTEDISVGHYTVTATKAASLNFIDISATFDFSINVINQDLLEFYNVSVSYPYKRNISLDTSGGSGSGNVTFGVSHNEYGTIPLVNGNTIIQDICAGFYTITATKGASLNFYEESITSTITVTRIDQNPFFITNESSYVFVEGQSIDIDTNGGSIESDITVVINLVNDEENFDDITLFNPNGEPRIIIPDVGTYLIRATKAGDINYVPAITNSIITITQATQSNLLFYNQPSYVYDPTQTIPLDVSGGSGDGAITFNVLYNGGELTDVTELVAPVVGDYWIEITKAESKNYFAITQEFPITILKADQQPLVNETLISSIVYYPELVIDLSASGGTTDKPITFTINGEPGTQLNSANNTNYIGNYSIVATKEGNENYNDVTLNFTISITKLLQLPIEITVPSVNNYELQNSSIEAKIKGGSTSNDFIISFDSNTMTVNNTGVIDEEGNQIYDIFYTRPGTVSMTVLKKGNEDYMDVSATVQFDIVKNMHHIKNTLHIRPRKAFNDPYIDEQDIISVYTVDELVDNMITNVFDPDPNLKNRFNTRELRNMNVNACVVYGTRRFTAADLKSGGYKITFCTR